MSHWKPTATLAALKARATLNAGIRQFFAERSVMEVEVPLMGLCTVTDPFIDSIRVDCTGREHYLQTSPEFAMKRLLAAPFAAELGCIYSLGKAFRNGESGRRHNPEFTMLEWYRIGFDDCQLREEVADLLQKILPLSRVVELSYRELFQRYLAIDPHTASLAQLQTIVRAELDIELDDDDTDTWLDLIVSHLLEPKLAEDYPDALVFIYDYPASQAALARTAADSQGQQVAKRFEGFFRGMELCNGYWELTDSLEQAQRFKSDQDKRRQLKLPIYPQDQRLVDALSSGLPNCAGVAMGVDRLLMLQQRLKHLDEVIAFPISRA